MYRISLAVQFVKRFAAFAMGCPLPCAREKFKEQFSTLFLTININKTIIYSS